MSRISDVPITYNSSQVSSVMFREYKYDEIDMRRDLHIHLTRQSYIRFGVCSWGVVELVLVVLGLMIA